MRVIIALLVPAFTAAIPLTTTDQPDPNEIQINSVSTSGSGCPRRAVSTTISEDRTVVTLGFDEFQTYIGKRFGSADRDKNCNIRLNLKYPGGYTYAVIDATYHGFAQLDSGVNGTLSSTYSFTDSATASTTQTSITGGGVWADGEVYTKHDVVPTEKVIRSPCGENVNLVIKTRINLTSNDAAANGSMTDDDATIAFTQQVHIGWQSCK